MNGRELATRGEHREEGTQGEQLAQLDDQEWTDHSQCSTRILFQVQATGVTASKFIIMARAREEIRSE